MFERGCVATVSACQGWRGVRAIRRAQRRQEEDPHLSPFTLTLTRRAQWRQEEFRRGLQRADAGAVRPVSEVQTVSGVGNISCTACAVHTACTLHMHRIYNDMHMHPGRLRGASARRHRRRATHWLGGRPHARALITTPTIHDSDAYALTLAPTLTPTPTLTPNPNPKPQP